MSISFDDAITQLAELTKNGRIATESELRALANSVSAYSSGSVTVLYSGDLEGGTSAGSVVRAMVANGEDVRAIGKTPAAALLEDLRFKTALVQTFGLSDIADLSIRGAPANKFLEGVHGLWGDLSQRFASETTGKVRIILGDFDINRILGVREIPELLRKIESNVDITEISGFTREQLLQIKSKYPATFETEIRNAFLVRAIQETVVSRPTVGNYGQFLNMTDAAFADLMKNASASDFGRIARFSDQFPMGRAAVKLLPKLGAGFAAMGLVLVSLNANAAYAAGRPDEAKQILEEYAAESAGSAVASTAAGALATIGLTLAAAAGVTVAAPVAVAAVLVATVAGGYFGGEWGKELLNLFQDKSEARARDIAQRMLKLVFGENYSLDIQIPQGLLAGGSLTLDSTFSREDMVNFAKADIAWRYALRELNPFVISGSPLYDKHNTDGSLDLYDEASGQGAMTELYLQDRAAMLTWKLRYDAENRLYTSEYNTSEVSGNWDFVDMSATGGSPLTLAIDGAGLSLYDHQVVFGSSGADLVEGSGDSDYLYGMAGDDRLIGDDGEDYLEGGIGNDQITGGQGNDELTGGSGSDTYYYSYGDGADTITDKDGTIVFNGFVLSGGKRKEDETDYVSSDGRNVYSWSGGDLLVNGSITVKNFINRDLGIYLDEEEKEPDPPRYDPRNAVQRIPVRRDPLILDLSHDGLTNRAPLEPPNRGLMEPAEGVVFGDSDGVDFCCFSVSL